MFPKCVRDRFEKVFGKSIEIHKTNKIVRKHQKMVQKCGRCSFVRFACVRVGIAATNASLSQESVC